MKCSNCRELQTQKQMIAPPEHVCERCGKLLSLAEKQPIEDSEEFDPDEPEPEPQCCRCGAPYDGGHRCGVCGNGDPEGTGEFDPETGEQ